MMDHVPGGFALNPRFHSIAAVEVTEDDLGRAIPEHVIAQLDVHLGLLGTSTGYASGGWAAADFARMYQVVYGSPDTGRRPGEVTSLRRDCLERVDGKPTLIYDNHKRRRHGRRLPISGEHRPGDRSLAEGARCATARTGLRPVAVSLARTAQPSAPRASEHVAFLQPDLPELGRRTDP